MALDMTGMHRFTREVHYRYYANSDGYFVIVCLQDFDYPDYDASRFPDLFVAPTLEEAQAHVVTCDDVRAAGRECADQNDGVGVMQAAWLIDAIERRSQLFSARRDIEARIWSEVT